MMEETYHDLHFGVVRPHRPDELRERRDDIRNRLILLHDVVGAQVHGDHVGGIILQPAIQLVLVRDVDGQEPRVALVVAVVLAISAVVFGFAAADKVYGGPLGGLEFLPEERAPADDFGDGVAEGHVAQGGVLGYGDAQQRQ